MNETQDTNIVPPRVATSEPDMLEAYHNLVGMITARCAQEFPNMGTTRRREKTIDDFDQSAISAGYRAGLEIKLGGALTAA